MCDRVNRVSYVQSTDENKYIICCRMVLLPAHVVMEKRDGPRKPERKKLVPAKNIMEIQVISRNNGGWSGNITYEEQNVSRKRAGSDIDNTWDEIFFFETVQSIIKSGMNDATSMFVCKILENDTMSFEIKQQLTVVNRITLPCILERNTKTELASMLTILYDLEKNQLFTNCRVGNIEKLQEYIVYGGDLSIHDQDEWNALQYACYFGQYDTVIFLLKHMTIDDINYMSKDGLCPILCAAKKSHTEIIVLLMDKGASILTEFSQKESVTHASVVAKNKDTLEYICSDDGIIADMTTKLYGVRSTAPLQRLFQTIDGYPSRQLASYPSKKIHQNHAKSLKLNGKGVKNTHAKKVHKK